MWEDILVAKKPGGVISRINYSIDVPKVCSANLIEIQ